MSPTEFISASVRGGYEIEEVDVKIIDGGLYTFGRKITELDEIKALLSPLAWSAVGKYRGWSERQSYPYLFEDGEVGLNRREEYKNRQLKFVSLLQDGQTLLGALAESTK